MDKYIINTLNLCPSQSTKTNLRIAPRWYCLNTTTQNSRIFRLPCQVKVWPSTEEEELL